MTTQGRAGRYVRQPASYSAFIPTPLPPDPPLEWSPTLIRLTAEAEGALGRLDGSAATLPNPELFVAMYVRQESVLSSQIEGTESSLDDVLVFELDPKSRGLPQDVEEVVNHVGAMNYGLERVQTLPLSGRLMREIHERLMQGVRGADKSPGEFRSTQNWIGPRGRPLSRATFVPPPPHEMRKAMDVFERWLHEEHELPPTVMAGLAHAQFETIHPFLDGNGRMGRLLITFILVQRNILSRPLLYLSHHFKQNRAEYYDRLMAVREGGDWEGWLRFFLTGVRETAHKAAMTAYAIVNLRERHRQTIQGKKVGGVNGIRALDILFRHPLINVKGLSNELGVSFPTANNLLDGFLAHGLVDEVTGQKRNRIFRYTPYLCLFDEEIIDGDEAAPLQTTEVAVEADPPV